MNAASPAPAAQPIPVFDLHCDTADRLSWQSLSGSLRKAAGMHFYGPGDEADPAGCRQLARNHGAISVEKVGATPWAQCFACFVPDELSPEEAVAFEAHVSAYLADQVAACAELGAVAVTRASQIRPLLEGAPAGKKDARLVAVRTIENARLFAADLGLVERLARQGLLMASLSWNAAGPLASGHDTHEGLSATGAAALAEMERCGVVMDVSHLNDECFADVAARARRPFVASHSNSRAVCGHPRNLTDDQFRCIRDAGGVVGLNYCTRFLVDGACGEVGRAVTPAQVMTHIEHWLDLDGEDVVALGGDLDGASVPDCLADAAAMPAFQQALLANFGEAVTRKLCYGNALAFFERMELPA